MGNVFKKDFFYLHCLTCNTVINDPERICCYDCGNVLITQKINEDINFNLSNYKNNIKFIETLCESTKIRIFSGYNHLKTIHNGVFEFKFKETFQINIEKPCGDIKNWSREIKISYFLYLINFYNNLIDYNYKIYEAILAYDAINNVYNNFSIKKICDNPPSYEQLFYS